MLLTSVLTSVLETAAAPAETIAPRSPDLLFTVLVQPASLLIAYLIGALMRRVLPQRVHLSTSSATLTALIGLWAGMATGSWLFREEHVWAPRIIAAAALVAAVVVVITAVVLSRIQHEPALAPIATVAARGESDRLEFKSSARVNMHTGKRDEAMETVVAKTVAAFLNARGGTLLLGVDDSGALIGLDPDYETLRQPDADRFELFLRDLWRTRLGANAAALPRLDFAPASDGEGEVCRVSVPPSPRPVYLAGAKGKDGRELWVRAGNSTQRLEVDDAVAYVAQRWPREVRPTLRSRIGTYLLYHRKAAPGDAGAPPAPHPQRAIS
ncbi:helix-turn-helix domain-containing protein [Actinomyces urogenitalis]|uniref:AlbA family DNA-binding domain-containing protein n=1 Tax=Actinomyces urogenitalis TaxID=103621 RepID=UPI002430265A|nr:ATP-binding protein [Actinomyces urogenitalis]MCI7457375.1 ATP-binding protein [Actinomyces urogenitalis]